MSVLDQDRPLARFLARPNLPHLLLIGIGLWAIARGPIIAKDTVGYVDSAIYRSPFYPLFLKLLHSVFADHAEIATVLVQTGLVLTAVALFVRHLAGKLKLARWQVLVVALLLAFPVLEPLEVGNRLLTEGVAYFFFLLAMRSLMLALETGRASSAIAFFVLSTFSVLTRPQFLFLYLVAAGLVCWLAVTERSWRKSGLLAITLFATIAIGSALDRGYRYWTHGEFISVPFKGLQLMAPALYLSQAADEALFGPTDAALFRALRERAGEARRLVDSNPDHGGVSSFAYHYGQVYSALVWRSVAPVFAEHRLGKTTLSGAEDFIEAEQTLRPMALTLVRARPRAHLRLYVSNLLAGLGTSFALLLILIGPILVWQAVESRRPLAMVIAVALLLHLTNCAFVAVVEPVVARYTFYSQWPLLASLFLLVSRRAREPDGPGNARSELE